MNVILLASALVCGALGLAFLLLFRKLTSRAAPVTAAAIPAPLSPERFRPMERLLSEEDFRYLAAHPGATPRMVRRLRAERRRLFRAYLRSLQRDFTRIYSAIQLILVQSEVDRPELAAALLK